jgi:hypothetical protein
MKTAVTEILEHCKKLISEGHQIDTQGLVHWIEDTLLEMEKQQEIKVRISENETMLKYVNVNGNSRIHLMLSDRIFGLNNL